MSGFTDSFGRVWSVTIDCAAVAAVRRRTRFRLDRIHRAAVAMRLTNPELMVSILYVLCEKQIAERELTPEEFGQAIYCKSGEILEHAAQALLEASADAVPEKYRLYVRAVAEQLR